MNGRTHNLRQGDPNTATDTLELTGYLGADRQIRTTRSGRDYALLSLAVHERTGGARCTRWQKLVVWNVDQLDRIQARICRKGDRVWTQGHHETFTYHRAGQARSLERFIVEDLRILRPRRAPEQP